MSDFIYDLQQNKDWWQELFGILFVILLFSFLVSYILFYELI